MLHHQVYILSRLDRFIQLHHRLVIDPGQNFDFPDDLLSALGVVKFRSVVLLDGHWFTTLLMFGFEYHSVGSLTDLLTDRIRGDL